MTRAVHTTSDDARDGRNRGARCDATPRGLDLREPRRLRHAVRASQRLAGYAANLERFDARLATLLPRLGAERPADRHRRSRQRSDDAEHRSLARARAGVRDRRRGRAPASISASAQTFADLGQTLAELFGVGPLAARHELPAAISCGDLTARGARGSLTMITIREQLEQREREILAPQAAKSADSRGRLRPEAEDRDPAGVPARSRSHHPLQGVPPAEAQDAGVLRADRRSLPHAPHAHARGLADRAQHRQGAAAERGADRGDRARPRPRPHAVRPRRRAGAQRARARRLQSLRAEPAHRRRPRARRRGA